MTMSISVILARVKYKDWALRIGDLQTPNPFLQWVFQAPCAKTGVMTTQSARKHRLSPHMTAAEIVQTAFLAALQAEEHECREFFSYNGHRIFNPHLSLGALVARAHEEESRAAQGGWHNMAAQDIE